MTETRHVYILSTHDEYGSDNLRATLDPSNLDAMLHHVGAAAKLIVTDEERQNLRSFLEDPDPTKAAEGRSLSRGWGGFILYIVELVEDSPEANTKAARKPPEQSQ